MKTSYPHSDTGNAELLNDLFGQDIRYDSKTQRWLEWRNAHRWYELEESEQIRRAIKTAKYRFDLAKEMERDSARAEVNYALQSQNLGRIENMLKIARSLPPIGNLNIKWDGQPNLLAVGNGVVNLSNATIRAGVRNDFVSQGLNLPFIPELQAPIWKKFLQEITLGRQDLVDFIQRAIGYTLTGFTREHVFFLLYGGGSNGKSVFINVLGKLLEGFSRTVRFSAFEETSLGDSKRDLAELPGIRAAFASEGAELKSLDTAMIKQVTGGEPITTSRKYGHPFTYQPQFKLWLTTNHLPKVTDDSLGFWRRVVILPFEATFEGSARDNQMQEKLEAEMPAILTWAINGAVKWSKMGLSTPDSLLMKVVEYRQAEDEVERFIEERCLKDPSERVQSSLLYAAYEDWCTVNRQKPLNATVFGRRMTAKAAKNHTRTGWIYEGLGLRIQV